jgi:hypothetical protein
MMQAVYSSKAFVHFHETWHDIPEVNTTTGSSNFRTCKWNDPEVHGMISFRTLNIRIALLDERLTAVLIYNISVLSVIHIKAYKSWILYTGSVNISSHSKYHSHYDSNLGKLCAVLICHKLLQQRLFYRNDPRPKYCDSTFFHHLN